MIPRKEERRRSRLTPRNCFSFDEETKEKGEELGRENEREGEARKRGKGKGEKEQGREPERGRGEINSEKR